MLKQLEKGTRNHRGQDRNAEANKEKAAGHKDPQEITLARHSQVANILSYSVTVTACQQP